MGELELVPRLSAAQSACSGGENLIGGLKRPRPTFPISNCLDAGSSPWSTRAMVVSPTNTVNHLIKIRNHLFGDTFVSGSSRVRLFGVDTPEVGQSCATEATERLRGLARDTVRVEPGPRSQSSFGRSLFYIYTEAGDSIDEILVKEGLGRAWTRDGQHRDYIVSVERSARTQETGCLW